MNLRQPNANEALGTANRSRNVAPVSGICTRCIDGCKGSCDIWLSTFRGREVPGAPPLNPARIRQVGLMIAERQAGPFAVEVRRIGLA